MPKLPAIEKTPRAGHEEAVVDNGQQTRAEVLPPLTEPVSASMPGVPSLLRRVRQAQSASHVVESSTLPKFDSLDFIETKTSAALADDARTRATNSSFARRSKSVVDKRRSGPFPTKYKEAPTASVIRRSSDRVLHDVVATTPVDSSSQGLQQQHKNQNDGRSPGLDDVMSLEDFLQNLNEQAEDRLKKASKK